MKAFLLLVGVLGIFGFGFYLGVEFAENRYVEDPSKLAELVKKSVKEGTVKGLEKAKDLVED